MEFADEWWKGDYPYSASQTESCPNLRSSQHNYCGSLITNVTFLNEEWLGVSCYLFASSSFLIFFDCLNIFEQIEVDYFLSMNKHCIKPREAFFTIAEWWTDSNITLEYDEYLLDYCISLD